MAKVSFANMKLKVDTSTKKFDFNGTSIEVLKYLPIAEKHDLVEIALQKATYNGVINEISLDMYFNLYLVYFYTNISFTDKQKEDEAELYDKLECSGLINEVIANMDETEYGQLVDYLNDVRLSVERHADSAAATLQKFINEFPIQMQEAVAAINNLHPEQFSEVRRMVELAQGSGIDNEKTS